MERSLRYYILKYMMKRPMINRVWGQVPRIADWRAPLALRPLAIYYDEISFVRFEMQGRGLPHAHHYVGASRTSEDEYV